MLQHCARCPKVLLASAAIALAALAAYHNSFSVPLIFDDGVTIQTNLSIQHLGALKTVLSPPSDVGSAGRPFLNLSFAVNYAIGGTSVKSYHVFNFLIHILAGIALFAIVRATLSQPRLKERYEGVSFSLALAAALLWTLHPVLTQSVTYISQRAESLTGLLYLLTLYLFIRAALSPHPTPWAALSIAACALGMMTKEVMVTAPIIVFLYDRTFIAGTFREALRRRWKIYLGLAATWLILAGLMAHSDLQSRGVGYGSVAWWKYGRVESKVVVGYLKLALWPHRLIFDYGPDVIINRFAQAAPYLLLLSLLLALTLLALVRWPSLGFLGAWFFIILAPTSSIVPLVGEPMGENRLYLPLVAIVVLAIAGIQALLGKKGGLVVFSGLAIVLGTLTIRRNSDYKDAITIWNDTIEKCPENFRAHYNLGIALGKSAKRLPEAIAQFEIALKLKPDDAVGHNNLGLVFAKIPGRQADAIAHYETALKLKPDLAETHNNLGMVLSRSPGRLPDAIAQFEAAIKLKPDDSTAQYNLGRGLARTPGRLPDAIVHYKAALKLKPDFADAQFNLGMALLKTDPQNKEAWDHFDAALRLKPEWEDRIARLRFAQP